MPIRLHVDDPDLLVQAIGLTARQTGFQPRLVEKDYFCSVVLEYLAASDTDLTFKGGTSLAKVHGSFYRLSEDLDFSISTPLDASRKERSRRAEPLKRIVGDVPKYLPELRLLERFAEPTSPPSTTPSSATSLCSIPTSNRSASRWGYEK